VGYNETLKVYMIFIPVQRKIVVIIYVKLEENIESRSTQESSTLIEDKEQQAPKDEKHSIVQTSGGEEELSPSIIVRRPRWLV
jgi:hypothetical protein